MKRQIMRKVMSFIVALAMVFSQLSSAIVFADTGTTHYLAFASDRHGNTSAIASAMRTFDSSTEYVGLIGDMVDSGSYNTSTVQSEATALFSGATVNIVWGSHDSSANDDAGIMYGSTAGSSQQIYAGPDGNDSDSNPDYYVYGVAYYDMENASNATTAAATFESWVDSIDKSIPIFVVCHMPMHASRNDNNGGYIWTEALNYAATGSETGTEITRNVVFMHGHNHTTESNKEYYYAPGESVTMESNGSDVSATIEFTYLTAGYLNANSHATQVTVTDDTISFNRSGTALGSVTRVENSDSSTEETTEEITDPTNDAETVSVSSSSTTGNQTICVGQKVTIAYTAGGSQTYTVATSDETVAKVSETSFTGTKNTEEDITVTGVSAGTATITVSRDSSVKATVTITVVEHSFTSYTENSDGTKTAACVNECGATKTVSTSSSGGSGSTEETTEIGTTDPTNKAETVSVSSTNSTGSSTICVGQEVIVSYSSSGSQTYTVATSDETVATVDKTSFTGSSSTAEEITVTGVSAGTATITVSRSGTVRATVTITVEDHSFTNYTDNGDGTKTAACDKECGATKTVESDTTTTTHNLTLVPAVAATCTVAGNSAYYTCSDCDKIFSDAEGTTETTLDEVTIAALGHNYASSITTEATCTSEGVKTYTCSRCGDSYTETIAKVSHTAVKHAAVAATCTATGTAEYYQCSVCNKYFTDADCTEETTLDALTVAATGHTWDEGTVTTAATCVAKGVKTYTCTVCDETKTEEIDIDSANHTGNTVVKNAKDATCGTAGYTGDTYCADCDTLLESGTTIAATGNHTWGEGVVTKEATEDETGVMTYTCTVCSETKTEVIPKTDHVHTYTSEVTDPTCTTQGYTTYTCSSCGYSYTADYTDALGHNYTSAVTTEPTCTTEGVKTYTCSRCGDSYTETIAATGHTVVAHAAVAATCTATGTEAYYECSVCGKYYTDEDCTTETTLDALTVAALGHNYEGAVTKAATCVATGTKTYTCTRCDDSYTEDIAIDADNHTGNTEVKNAVEATCGTAGYTGDTYCSDCGTLLESGTTVAATGNHTYDDGEVTTEATCTTAGVKTYTCSVCKGTYTEEIAATGHTVVAHAAVAATCTSTGTEAYYECSVCGKYYTDEDCTTETTLDALTVAALGHNYEGAVTKAATCVATGTKTYTCTRCDDSYTEDIAIDADNHTGNTEVKNAVEATCGTAGYTGDTYCADCGTLLESGTTIAATGNHTWGEGVVTKEATEDETGVMTYTCTVCGSSYTEEIAKLDHVHTYTSEVTDPTCSSQGYTTYTCSSCGYSYKANFTSALGHTYKSEVTTEPTCTEAGVKTVTCTRCGDSYTEAIKATGHTAVKHEAVAATCTSTGTKAYYQCSVCGKYYTDEDCTIETTLDALTIAAKDHTWNAGEVTTAATCVSTGIKTYTCTVCGETKTEEIAVDANNHTGNTFVQGAVEATDTTEGYTGDTYCADCGNLISKGKTIATTDHEHSYTSTVKAATCVAKGTITYTCKECGYSYTEEIAIDADNHAGTITKTVVEPTCTAKGYTVNTCSACGVTYKDNYTSALGHDYTDDVIAIEKTANTTKKTNGTYYKTCSRCGEAKATSNTLYYAYSVTLSKTSYVYSGYANVPKVTVKDTKGNTISSKYYTVKYSNDIKVGKATVTVTMKNGYSGSFKKTFKIYPKATTLSSVTAASKAFTVKWKKQSTQTTGYQICYSTSSKFTSPKYITVSGNTKTSYKKTKLSKKKTYYVRIRTYKTVSGTRYYSSWSTAMKVKTK